MTDFGPLIANPKSILLGAAAQHAYSLRSSARSFIGDMGWANFGFMEAASIGIIGGADGPTAIYVTKTLAPTLFAGNCDCGVFVHGARSDYSAANHEGADDEKKERSVVMEKLRPVSKREDSVPDYRYNCCWPDCFGRDSACWYADAR